MAEKIILDNIELILANPVNLDVNWIGQREILEQLLACWLTVTETDRPLTPKIVGIPGVGKTTLAMAAAKIRKQELYIFQCTADTRPEDLIITPVLNDQGKIAYHCSALATAVIRGGICILDEGNRMNEKSWASIAPLLDFRRYTESIITGLVLKAHQNFRCCITMNEDESTYQIPEYILSRLTPTLEIDFPDKQDELLILKYHLPFAPDDLLNLTVEFLQEAHSLKLDYSPRDGINIVRYALKRIAQDKNNIYSNQEIWKEALIKTLGKDALDLKKLSEQKKINKGEYYSGLGLDDIFFDDDFKE